MSPNREVKCFQASVCTPANAKIVASVTAEFRQRLVSVVPLCYGGPFAEGSCCGSRIGIKLWKRKYSSSTNIEIYCPISSFLKI